LFCEKVSEKNLELVIAIDKNIPDILMGDPTRLSQILINLIGNAVKFTHSGMVKLQVNVEKETLDSVTVSFLIEDTGIGISDDRIAFIFDGFSQASNETTRKYGGTGLGLTIVKRLTELQGGTISVTSKLDKGTAFHFSLPYLKFIFSEPLDKKLSKRKNHEALLGLKILAAEDNSINQLLLKKMLIGKGCEIDIAVNGKIALEMLNKKDYDLILMDIRMPEVDGYETCRQIRNLPLPSKKNIPILAMTAHTNEYNKSIASGMNDYISKPFEAEDLYEKIEKIMGPKSLKKNTPSEFYSTRESNDRNRIDISYLKNLSEDDDSFLTEAINLYIKDLFPQFKELKKAFECNDWKKLKDIAHKVRPSVNIIGMKQLKTIMETIEKYATERTHKNLLPQLIDQANELSDQALRQLHEELEKLESYNN
jgi:CheY-like chemotaxis protein